MMFQKVQEWIIENRGKILGIIGVVIGYLVKLKVFVESNIPEPVQDTVRVIIDAAKDTL